MPDEFPRVQRRSQVRVFQRADQDAQPQPRLSSNIQLVQVFNDLTHLQRPVANPSYAANAFRLAPGVGIRVGFQLSAPSTKSLAVWLIDNINPVTDLVFQINDPAVFTPVVDSPRVEWGDEPLLSELVVGDLATAVAGFALTAGESFFTGGPLILDPGNILIIGAGVANLNTSCVVVVSEVG